MREYEKNYENGSKNVHKRLTNKFTEYCKSWTNPDEVLTKPARSTDSKKVVQLMNLLDVDPALVEDDAKRLDEDLMRRGLRRQRYRWNAGLWEVVRRQDVVNNLAENHLHQVWSVPDNNY